MISHKGLVCVWVNLLGSAVCQRIRIKSLPTSNFVPRTWCTARPPASPQPPLYHTQTPASTPRLYAPACNVPSRTSTSTTPPAHAKHTHTCAHFSTQQFGHGGQVWWGGVWRFAIACAASCCSSLSGFLGLRYTLGNGGSLWPAESYFQEVLMTKISIILSYGLHWKCSLRSFTHEGPFIFTEKSLIRSVQVIKEKNDTGNNNHFQPMRQDEHFLFPWQVCYRLGCPRLLNYCLAMKISISNGDIELNNVS